MQEYFFGLKMVGSLKAVSREEAEKKINTYNVVGAKLLTANNSNNFKFQKIKVHDIDITYND